MHPGLIWLITAVIGLATICFVGGLRRWDEDDAIGWGVIVILWPIVLVVLVVVGPLVGLYLLGTALSRRAS